MFWDVINRFRTKTIRLKMLTEFRFLIFSFLTAFFQHFGKTRPSPQKTIFYGKIQFRYFQFKTRLVKLWINFNQKILTIYWELPFPKNFHNDAINAAKMAVSTLTTVMTRGRWNPISHNPSPYQVRREKCHLSCSSLFATFHNFWSKNGKMHRKITSAKFSI